MNNTKREVQLKPKPEAVLYTRAVAAGMLSVSARRLDYWIAKGLVRAVKLGRRRVAVPASEVVRIGRFGIVDVRRDVARARNEKSSSRRSGRAALEAIGHECRDRAILLAEEERVRGNGQRKR